MVYLIIGLPASGKTTYVQQHKKANDIVYDFDYLCAALTLGKVHEQRNELSKEIANDLMIPLIGRVIPCDDSDMFVIRTAPNESEAEYFRSIDAKPVYLQEDISVCVDRMINRDGEVPDDIDYKQINMRLQNFLRSWYPPYDSIK